MTHYQYSLLNIFKSKFIDIQKAFYCLKQVYNTFSTPGTGCVPLIIKFKIPSGLSNPESIQLY